MKTPLIKHAICTTFFLSFLVSCGGSTGSGDGSSKTPRTPSGNYVLMDRSAGTQDVASALVAGVVFEDQSGNKTANLLASTEELMLTNAAAALGGLELRAAPRAVYRSIHIIFVPGSHELRWKAGGRDVIDAPTSIEAKFTSPVEIAPGDWITLRHARPVVFKKDQQGKVRWNLDLVPEHRSPEIITGARIKVVSIEARELAAWGTIENLHSFIVRMQFSDDAVLIRADNQRVGAVAFVDGLRIGTELLVDGRLEGRYDLHVSMAEDMTWPGQPNQNQGVKTKVFASIESIQASSGSMRLNVLEVLRHGRGPLPPRSVLVYGESAKIKWNPHKNRTPKHVPFSSLAVDMLIEAEWKTPESYGSATVDKIRIKAER